MTGPTPSVPPVVLDILARCREAGIRLSPSGSDLRFSAPGPLPPEFREVIKAHKAEILAALSVWCPTRATALQVEADGLVEKLGVTGTDPEIAVEAARCVEAHANQDMAGVRAACHAIEDRARKLAARSESTA